MFRTDTFGFRVTDEERGLIKAVAERLQRDESDTIRLLVRNVAQELGVATITQPDRRSDQMEKQVA
jgi:hypothetical protein